MVCAAAKGGRQDNPMTASQQHLLVDILCLHASEERQIPCGEPCASLARYGRMGAVGAGCTGTEFLGK
jgi:hypothetical protein